MKLDPALQPKFLPDMPPRFEFAFQARVVTGAVLPLDFGGINRLMVEVAGGDFEGPKLRGRIRPGGVEWPTYRPDGVGMVDARYTLETDDGAYINIRNFGYRRASPEVMARLNAFDDTLDPSQYYIRTTPLFEAPPGPYGWLADHCFVAIGERARECLFLRFYTIL